MVERGHDSAPDLATKIFVVRGRRVLLDSDLAQAYGVQTKVFNQAIRRNLERFPGDFGFQLDATEWGALRSQIVTLETGRGRHRKFLPFVFTEHGAIMAASVLQTQRAVEMSVYVVRAFVRLRAVLASNAELSRKLAALERSVATLDADMRRQFDEVYAAIRALMVPPKAKRRSIGFTADLDESE